MRRISLLEFLSCIGDDLAYEGGKMALVVDGEIRGGELIDPRLAERPKFICDAYVERLRSLSHIFCAPASCTSSRCPLSPRRVPGSTDQTMMETGIDLSVEAIVNVC